MPASEPTIFSKMEARAITSPSPHALVVQIKQAPARVVFPLDRPVDVPVVEPPELVLAVEGRGVERLVPVELVHRGLDEAVVVAVELSPWQRYHAPEPEVHVELARFERIERPARARPQRAHPDRRHA